MLQTLARSGCLISDVRAANHPSARRPPESEPRYLPAVLDFASGPLCAFGEGEPGQGRLLSPWHYSGRPTANRVEEATMEFLTQNWFYIVALILFVAMHLVGPGCGHAHPGPKHSSHNEPDGHQDSKTTPTMANNRPPCPK